MVGRKRPGWGVGVELVFWWRSQLISLRDVFFLPADVYEGPGEYFSPTPSDGRLVMVKASVRVKVRVKVSVMVKASVRVKASVQALH